MQHLYRMILAAYEFDDDHLYSFFMDGKMWSEKSIVSQFDDYGQTQADKVQIGDLGLVQRQSFQYLYDYGDEWKFNIVLEEVIEQDSVPFEPFVKERSGEGPDQYIDWS